MTFTRKLLFVVAAVAVAGIAVAGPASALVRPAAVADTPQPFPAFVALVDGPGPFPAVTDSPAGAPARPFEGGPPTKNITTGREGDPPGPLGPTPIPAANPSGNSRAPGRSLWRVEALRCKKVCAGGGETQPRGRPPSWTTPRLWTSSSRHRLHTSARARSSPP